MIKIAAVAIAICAISGCATTPTKPLPATATEWADSCQVKDDKLEPAVRVQCFTSPGFWDAGIGEGVIGQRRWLQAAVDRRSADTTVVIALDIQHFASKAAGFNRGTYIGPDGKAQSATVSGRLANVHCSGGGRCEFSEQATLLVNEADLRQFVATQPASTSWMARFGGSGRTVDLVFSGAEIRGFLLALDRQRGTQKPV